jgi:hypothetical protein
MSYAALPGKAPPLRLATSVALALVGVLLALVWASPSASAASLVGKDGRIHACYKAKGKAKGTLRVVRSAKVRCPRHWKKVAWNASGQSGSSGEQGSSGEPGTGGENGQAGGKGETGAQSTAAKVSSLESKVTELLAQVKSLQSVLGGINNAQLKEAIGTVPVVQMLCAQAGKLNEQSAKLGQSLSALNTVLEPLLVLFNPVGVPTALPAFACPAP